MNDQTGTALLHGNAIKIASSPVVPPGDRTIDHASLPRAPFRDLDRAIAAALARTTGGLSPAALWLAYSDWAMHFGAAPGKQLELTLEMWQDWARVSGEAMRPAAERRSETSLQDSRFRGDAWQQFPYRLWYENFLLTEQWWRKATHGVAGVSPHHEDVVTFAARQWLDMLSPSNLPWTNPEVAQEIVRTGGQNLVAGFFNWSEDVRRVLAKQAPAGAEAFEVGKNLATTPGKVVFRNHLIELIQYTPVTETVHPEPVLIVPAWIMKYYILDLSPQNSLIGYLVGQGFTVFCISWRNVTADDRDVSLEDYRRLGVMAALDTIASIIPGQEVHATGYCLGGTLLTLAAAAMAKTADHRLKTMTLLAAQTDFSEPGELDLFIDDSQVSALESMMWQNGTLDATQMAGAFQILNSNDLIWSHLIHDYLMGQRTLMIDLMAWNADTTRMPYRMHSDYLRKLFLGNDLAAVGTERDHIAPWHSVYKIHYLSDTDVTFALTSGGHNAGIVNEPGHPHRHFRIASKTATDPCLSADEWLAATPIQEGSWWPAWAAWLAGHSTSPQISPPAMGGVTVSQTPLTDAPGTYVSTLLGTELPGPGTIYLGQDLHFRKPVAPGDTITAVVTVQEKRLEKRIVLLNTRCTNQRGEEVLTGTATVIAPAEKLSLPRIALPEVALRRHDRFKRFLQEARDLPPLLTAIVHPCNGEAIQAAIEARDEGLITPVLVGPEHKIHAAAEQAGLSIAGLQLVPTEHSHAAAARAVELAATGEVAALMKGSLHTDELLGAVVAMQSRLRTERRISHVYVLDVPTYPKPLIITDAAINIAPTLEQKRDICQNAIDLLHVLGIAKPLVAVLAAIETVNPAMQATLDAAALTAMAARGQITGAAIDGPLAFDNAISFNAARIKEIVSPVAGQADILVVPDLEAGNMLAKQLIYLAGADAAGLVLGARVPIILTSRSDSQKVRLASAALAKLASVRRKSGLPTP